MSFYVFELPDLSRVRRPATDFSGLKAARLYAERMDWRLLFKLSVGSKQ